jgi:tetratricopeptide (TPR) repeat protein
MKNNKQIFFITIGAILVLYIAFRINFFYGAALVLIAILAAVFSNRAALYSLRGNKFYASGDMDTACAWYRRALASKNCKPRTRISFGYLLLKMGRLEESDSIFREVGKLKLNEADKSQYKMSYALVKWKSGKLEEAIEMLQEVYDSYKCTTVYESLGYLLLLKGDLEKALEFNLEAHDYNGDDNVIADNLGETYYYMGNYEKSLEVYERLIPKNPNFPEPYYHYGLLLAKKDKKDTAISMFEKALTFKQSFLSNLSHNKIELEISKIKPE